MEAPPMISFDAQPFDLSFHPVQNIVAAGLVSGNVQCYRYAPEGNTLLYSIKPHKKPCRAVEFNHDGTVLFTASKDKSLQAIDAATGSVMIKKTAAHLSPINSMLRLNESVLVTGDDGGAIKAWDIRSGEEVMECNENEDYISDMAFNESSKTLLATSADGFLSVFDIRKSKPLAISENQDDELLSVIIMKGGKKVAVGLQEGPIHIFNWGAWGDCTDRFVGHPSSIDTMVKADEDVFITGSSDGIIRVCSLLPNDLMGVIGHHEDFPIEKLRLSHDEAYLASCSHDDTVRFWSMEAALRDESEANDGEGMEVDSEPRPAPTSKKGKKKGKSKENTSASTPSSFFADL